MLHDDIFALVCHIWHPVMWLLHMHTLRCQCWNHTLCSPSAHLHLLSSISPLLRLTTSVTPQSPAVAQKKIDPLPCRSTVGFTLAPSRRPSGGSWAAFGTASHQRNSSRRVSWWSWWARDWWTPCAGRPNVEGPRRASCVRATTCVLSWSSWLWPPRRQRCTSRIGKLCTRLKSLQRN